MSFEGKGFRLPNEGDMPEASPERQYEVLLQMLEDLSGPTHEGIDPAITMQAIENTKNRIAELKREFPQLNN